MATLVKTPMVTPIFLKSTDCIQRSKSHDFTIRFTPELALD